MDEDVVLVDSDVFSEVILRPGDRSPRVADWREHLLGKVVIIAAQTEGELRFGARVGVPLLSGDGIFRDCPSLRLVSSRS